MKFRYIILGALAFGALIITFMAVGVNHNGYRTVVQRMSGETFVKFEPGLYFQWFGTTTEYPDYITYDFNRDAQGGSDASVTSAQGVAVRYQDGGMGTIYGIARFVLPSDAESMLKLHRAFRSANGVAWKLLKTTTDERVNLTAGLMTSEEAYNAKRSTFTEWAREQIQHGKFKTTLRTLQRKKEDGTGEIETVDFPVIEYGKDGVAIYLDNDLKEYLITLGSFQLGNPEFEQKTNDQIAAKRKATMAIITSKAEAESAKQAAQTAVAEGERAVTVAKYEKEVEKSRALVEAAQQAEVANIAAKREADVATIKAKQLVTVAEQAKLQEQQRKDMQALYKEAETLRGEGDAAYKKSVIQADGALAQKLETYKAVMTVFAQEFGKQKWVPDISMAAAGDGKAAGSNAAAMIDLLTAKTAKDLQLDLGVSTGKQ